MKRIALATAVAAGLLSSITPAHAQFGLRGGVNLSKFVGGDATDEQKTKLNLGASIPLFHIGPLSIVPEVYYAQRGGERQLSTTEGGIVNPLASFSMNYIEVPVLARLTIPIGGPLALYVAGGPSYAWQLKCDVSFASVSAQSSGEKQDCEETQFTSAKTALANADRGIVGNAGLNIAVGPFGLVNLDFRVVRGLTRIIEDDTGPETKSQAISLMLGYSFGAGAAGVRMR